MLNTEDVIKQITHWHVAKQTPYELGDLQGYQARRTAGGKYVMQFLYGFDKSRHGKIGPEIHFSSFKNWAAGMSMAEEYLLFKAAATADDFLVEDEIGKLLEK